VEVVAGLEELSVLVDADDDEVLSLPLSFVVLSERSPPELVALFPPRLSVL
jgi:hypothetical protein